METLTVGCPVLLAVYSTVHLSLGEDSFPYAERSTVFVFGRIGLKTRDGLTTPKLTVFGVYADPRRSRRMTGGDTAREQFN